MPLDTPSQFQTGLAKGLEGLFSGMAGSSADKQKLAYQEALLRLKGDQAVELKKQPNVYQTNKTFTGTMDQGNGKGKGGSVRILPAWGAKDIEKDLRTAISGATGQSLADTFDPYSYDPGKMTPEQAAKANQLFKNLQVAKREEFNRRSVGQPNFTPYDTNVPDYFVPVSTGKRDAPGLFTGDEEFDIYDANPDWADFLAGKKPRATAPAKKTTTPSAKPKSKAASRLDAALEG
jgi:hypothetical protein